MEDRPERDPRIQPLRDLHVSKSTLRKVVVYPLRPSTSSMSVSIMGRYNLAFIRSEQDSSGAFKNNLIRTCCPPN